MTNNWLNANTSVAISKSFQGIFADKFCILKEKGFITIKKRLEPKNQVQKLK